MSDFINNPITNRPVRVGSTVYQRLVKKGLISENGEQISKAYTELPQQIAQKKSAQQISQKKSTPMKIPSRVNQQYIQEEVYEEDEYEDDEEEEEEIEQYQPRPRTIVQKSNGNKMKKPLDIKINSILDSGIEAYKKVCRNIPHDMTEQELNNYIRQDLIKQLKASNNKYISRYL